MNIYEQRRKYIETIYNKLIKYQKKGYLIFDENNENISDEKIVNNSDGYFALKIGCVVYYLHCKELDNGYYTPLPELRKTFSEFKIVKPKNIITLEKFGK